MAPIRSRPCEEGIIKSTPPASCPASAKPWVPLAAVLASSITYIDESVVNVASPAIETDLAASAVVIQWLVNAYTLSLSALLLVGGAAGDQFGRRRFFVIGLGIFAVASAWCGMAPNLAQLITARRSGRRRRAAHSLFSGDYRRDFRRSRTRQGDRYVGRFVGGGIRVRTDARRMDRRPFQLALDFSH
jgi:hypothetical protein